MSRRPPRTGNPVSLLEQLSRILDTLPVIQRRIYAVGLDLWWLNLPILGLITESHHQENEAVSHTVSSIFSGCSHANLHLAVVSDQQHKV